MLLFYFSSNELKGVVRLLIVIAFVLFNSIEILSILAAHCAGEDKKTILFLEENSISFAAPPLY